MNEYPFVDFGFPLATNEYPFVEIGFPLATNPMKNLLPLFSSPQLTLHFLFLGTASSNIVQRLNSYGCRTPTYDGFVCKRP